MAEPTIFDDADDPGRAIRVGDTTPSGEGARWGHLLTLFMRIMAAFWMLQGLMQWHVILTAKTPIFNTMPPSAAIGIIFFAVLDLIAGVGLWLATPWGGVLWLLIAGAQIFVASSMPGFFVGGYWLVGLNLVLIALYFVLTFEAGRDYEALRLMERRRRQRRDPRAALSAASRKLAVPFPAFTAIRNWIGRRGKASAPAPKPKGRTFEQELDALAQSEPTHFQPRAGLNSAKHTE
jgi:hypothetical protein